MHEQQTKLDPGQFSWPENGLEAVPYCPACGDENRSLLHGGLVDYAFSCAPGQWSLYICQSCGINYLDPRPTPASIHLAYTDYYTHTFNKAETDRLDGNLALFRRALGNGYRNWRFGDNARPASRFGVLAAYLRPGWRQHMDRLHRHLPRFQSGKRLLDVGCGDGAFLERAQSIGWSVQGVDPDPNAVAAARKRGIDVAQGGLERFDGQSGLFDVVTLSHVIEHVHDPVTTMIDIHRLLKPGGYVWIDTPNAEAYGHRLFGPSWRGLEPPRHLVIFTWDALERVLVEAGFRTVRRHVCTNNFGWLAKASEDIRRAAGARALAPSRLKSRRLHLTAYILSKVSHRYSDFITLGARK